MLKHRWRFLPVELNTKVSTINYSQGDRGSIETSRVIIRPEKFILVVSNGVLPRGIIKFSPRLNPEKLDSIHHINMGLFNHVAVLFKKSFYQDFNNTDNDINLYYKID